MEYLDEVYPNRPLLPKDPVKKAFDKIIVEATGPVRILEFLFEIFPVVHNFSHCPISIFSVDCVPKKIYFTNILPYIVNLIISLLSYIVKFIKTSRFMKQSLLFFRPAFINYKNTHYNSIGQNDDAPNRVTIAEFTYELNWSQSVVAQW